jgi:hypothetical protein
VDDWPNELSHLIVQDELRAKQVRSAELTATGIDAVTGAADARIDDLPAIDDLRIGGRTLLRRECRAAAAASTPGRRRLSLRCWRLALGRRDLSLWRRGLGGDVTRKPEEPRQAHRCHASVDYHQESPRKPGRGPAQARARRWPR